MLLEDVLSGATVTLPSGASALAIVTLPNDLVWSDEFSWDSGVGEVSYSLTGALIYEVGVKQQGRPITLVAPDNEMAWVSRDTLLRLWALTTPPTRKLRLTLQYPTDTRSFIVMFRHGEVGVTGDPVTTFASHDDADWFKISLKLMEVE